MKTKDDTIKTPYGGSVPFNKLEQRPAMKRIWAGYAFSVDYNKARGHYYALIDQKKTKRQNFAAQPGACANCHAAEAPQLIQQMGWENFNHTPYKEISSTLHTGHLLRGLPRPGHNGTAHHSSGLQERHGCPWHRFEQGDAPGDAHLRLRAVPRRVLLQGRQQDPDFPVGQGT